MHEPSDHHGDRGDLGGKNHHGRSYFPWILDLGIAALLAVALLVVLRGGFQFSIGSTRFSAHGLAKPLAACAALAVLRVRIARRAPSPEPGSIACRIGFLALFGALLGTWLLVLVTSCGGADSYGYVSTSRLLRSLRLSDPEPSATHLPLAGRLNAAAPVGYVAVPDRKAIVPGYPLGMPAVMAFFGAVFGDGAEFYVSPLLAALAVVAAYGIAREFSDSTGAWLSAWFVAITPIFFHQAIQPMSDAAATFWLLLTVWLLIASPGRPPLSDAAAGIAAGMAFLTRPALVSAAVVLVVVVLAFKGRRAAAVFVSGFLPFVALQAWLHWRLFGRVLTSGYGTPSQIFTFERVPANIASYFAWVNYSASPLFLLTLALGAVLFGSRRWWAAAVGIAAGVAAPYLLYFTYGDWQDTRFLLPGLALAMIVCGVTVRNLAARWVPRAVAPLVVLAIAGAAAAASYRFLDRHHTFALARIEARYPRVGEWIDRSAPPRTVVFAFLHSGSVRFYAARPTARWDQMSGREIGASVAALKAQGWESWAVVDGPPEAEAFWPRLREVEETVLMQPRGRVAGVDIVSLDVR